MRLLRRDENGNFTLTLFSGGEAIPRYAILSHTWGADTDEVSFEDLTNGAGTDKPGFEKVRFCGEQAAQDGLKWFWIDTCCVDKTNNAELSQAIRSMFLWYRNATRCYVFLADVPRAPSKSNKNTKARPWEVDFQASRWFMRGWTLQELIAPRSVEFFSCKWERLGDKVSLEQPIHETTSIPYSALQGAPLSQFSVNQRLLWREHRQTKLEEDAAYSLLGIFDVYIAPIYGEGIARAFERLMDEIKKLEKCIQDLRLTDPCDDKKRIEDVKGGLLEDSYRWILQNPDFQKWQESQQNQLLWIKGDPGKGKTMLLCGIINKLNKSIAYQDLLAYFFCQATDARVNSATTVLRGLLYLLVRQQSSLVSHIRKKYDHAGKSLFTDANAWIALVEIFENILQDTSLGITYLIVDALDECVADLPKLLDFIAQQSSASPRIKWIVASRNWPDIEERLARAGHGVRLSLELNAKSVSTAVSVFIQQKVLQLVEEKKYNEKTRDLVQHYLSLNADGTFLWVALLCQDLRKIPRWKVLTKLGSFPPGLDSLYRRMLDQINNSDDADLCKRILASIATVYRPVTLQELAYLVELPNEVGDLEIVHEIVSLCGSFLTVRGGVVYFVHQSAKDFLLEKAQGSIFPSGRDEVHHELFSRSLQAMSTTLRRDMYGLGEPGYPAEKIEPPDPDPLVASRYSCIYWVNHLYDCNPNLSVDHSITLQDIGAISDFIREKYLYWLEALSLCKSMSEGVISMAKLEALLQASTHGAACIEIVKDAHRFILYHKWAIENSPLQTYVSALVFSPGRSLIRNLFKREEPKWITIKPAIGDAWGTCLSTFEGHSSGVSSVAFSHDSTWVASASYDHTVKIWNSSSGACLSTLEGHSGSVDSVAFSHDSTRLVSSSSDGNIKIWDASSGACLLTLEGHSDMVLSVAFSYDSMRLASASQDNTVKIWNANSGTCLLTLEGHSQLIDSVAFSHDSKRLASASADRTVKIWDASNGVCLSTLEAHSDVVTSVAFSHDSMRLASASHDNTVKIWDASSGACLLTFEGYRGWVTSVAFSHDSTQLASGSGDNTVKIWDANSGLCISTFKDHTSTVTSVAFSHNSTRLASGSGDGTVKIWDASSGAFLSTLEAHSDKVESMAFSHNSAWVASGSAGWDKTVKIWDASSGVCLLTLEGHSQLIDSVAFSHDSMQLASSSWDGTIKIWDTSSGVCLATVGRTSHWVQSVAFSHNSTRLASTLGNTIKIWDASSGACLKTLEGHRSMVHSVVFSHDSTRLASTDGSVKIWDASSGVCLSTLEGHSQSVTSVAFSHDSARVASGSDNCTVKVWDASSGACLFTLEGHSGWVYSVAFSHNSTWLASALGDTVKIWEASSGVCLQTLEGHRSSVYSVAFSHDSTRLASGSADDTVKIWDASSGTCLATIEGHSCQVKSVAFSHDSAWVASGSHDYTTKIWDASSGACLSTFKGHSSFVDSVAFSHDSTRLVSSSYDGTIKIWDTSSGACLQTLAGHGGSGIISFDTTGVYLHTKKGTISISADELSLTLIATNPQTPEHKNLAISSDGTWITHNSKDLVWLPSEYRPSCSAAVFGKMISIGVGNGRVWIFEILA